MDAEEEKEKDQQDSGQDACQKELVDSDLGDDGIDDQGKTGRKEKTQGS